MNEHSQSNNSEGQINNNVENKQQKKTDQDMIKNMES